METPKLTPWEEKNIGTPEQFKVYKPCRINLGNGKGARAYQRGETVTVFGEQKKELYFQNKIMYPKDFDAVMSFEKSQKKVSKEDLKPPGDKESSDESTKNLSKKN